MMKTCVIKCWFCNALYIRMLKMGGGKIFIFLGQGWTRFPLKLVLWSLHLQQLNKIIMKKMKNKTISTRVFNELLGERRVNFLYGTLLCLLLLVPANSLRAQSNDSIPIVFEKVPVDDEFDEIGQPERDLELEAILPTAMYDVSNENLLLFSQHVTFDSVTYYIMDESGIIVETDEIILPKNVEVTLPIAQLFPGSYIILLEIDDVYFQGRFVK